MIAPLRALPFAWLMVLTLALAASAEPLSKALEQKTSLVFERSSLQEALGALQVAVRKKHPDFAIKVAGQDLQAEGITRNQVLRDFQLKDQPVADILTTLMLQANPVRDLKPSDRMQKLVWVVATDPADAEREIILITTRSAAKKRGDELPEVFREVTKKTP